MFRSIFIPLLVMSSASSLWADSNTISVTVDPPLTPSKTVVVVAVDPPTASPKVQTPAVPKQIPGPNKPAAKVQKSLFHVKYVAHDSVYIDGGTTDDLVEGMTIMLRRRPPGSAEVDAKQVGEAIVRAVATTSAVCELTTKLLPPAVGDEARLSNVDEIARAKSEASKGVRKYLQVVEFNGKDPFEEEERAYTALAKKPEIDRIRGSIAFERDEIIDHGSNSQSAETGASIHLNYGHIGGSFWSAVGYWRGSFTTSNTNESSSTLQDLMNRTYQIGLFYANPESDWAVGIGRLFIPGATSLGVFDGGYVTRRLTTNLTAGFFAGTDPDPTQWNFSPNRQTTGTFARYVKGNYDSARWATTVGIAIDRLNWRPERQYLFTENNFNIGRVFSIFESLQADQRNPQLMNGEKGAQLSQSFTTVRIQPLKRFGFDVNHNYLRGVPTFDSRLLGTGLLDQYLFTGFSGTVRVEPISQLMLTASLGESRTSTDTSHALNEYYGIAWKRLPFLGLRVDAKYNRFNSSFGHGDYRSIAVSRELFDNVRFQFEGGVQTLASALVNQGTAHYLNTTVNYQLATHYFMNGGWLFYRGVGQNYDQFYVSLGYRFR